MPNNQILPCEWTYTDMLYSFMERFFAETRHLEGLVANVAAEYHVTKQKANAWVLDWMEYRGISA